MVLSLTRKLFQQKNVCLTLQRAYLNNVLLNNSTAAVVPPSFIKGKRYFSSSSDVPPPAVLGDKELNPVVRKQIFSNISNGARDAFYIVDLANVIKRHKLWNSLLPRVKPFYAVKCNPDTQVLQTLAQLGCGFDCASKLEIDMMLSLGVSPDDIIFANPCKQESHIEWSKMRSVKSMTFDSIEELDKISQCFPQAECILRILVDDSCSQAQLGMKYGASITEIPALLQHAKKLNLNIVGLSFHVGSGCYKASAYADAVYHAKNVFNLATNYGYNFKLLDVGGGFPGSDTPGSITFNSIATALSEALDKAFPPESGVQLMSEPGRFYVASSHTLAVNIIGRKTKNAHTENPNYMYYINDGLYGSFNCLLYDHAILSPHLLTPPSSTATNEITIPSNSNSNNRMYQSSMWGPTCDGYDCVFKNIQLPLLNVGEWFYFVNMGAYTSAAGSRFNGFTLPEKSYVNSIEDIKESSIIEDITKEEEEEQLQQLAVRVLQMKNKNTLLK